MTWSMSSRHGCANALVVFCLPWFYNLAVILRSLLPIIHALMSVKWKIFWSLSHGVVINRNTEYDERFSLETKTVLAVRLKARAKGFTTNHLQYRDVQSGTWHTSQEENGQLMKSIFKLNFIIKRQNVYKVNTKSNVKEFSVSMEISWSK